MTQITARTQARRTAVVINASCFVRVLGHRAAFDLPASPPFFRALKGCSIPGLQETLGINNEGAKQATGKIAVCEPETGHISKLPSLPQTAYRKRWRR